MLRMKNVKSSSSDWFSLQQTLVAASKAKDNILVMLANVSSAESRAASATSQRKQSFASNSDPFFLKQFIADASLPGLALLQSTLSRFIDWAASKERGQLSIQPGIDVTLDEYRRTYEGRHFYNCAVCLNVMRD